MDNFFFHWVIITRVIEKTAWMLNSKNDVDAKVDSKGDWVTKARKNHINCSEMLLK